MVVGELRVFLSAIGFFTRLPVPAWVGHSAAGLDQAVRYLPLVGVLVGLAGAAATELAALLLPLNLAVLLGMAATAWLTGALHEDGFADACDGFGGGWDKDRVLAIMKDSRLGSYGAIGLVLLLLGKYQALLAIDDELELFAGAFDEGWSTLPFALVAGHGVSRLAALAVMARLDYAREGEAKAAALAHRPGPVSLAWGAVCGLAPCLFLPRYSVAFALLLVAATTVLALRYFRRRIGGYTGDCLGAVQQGTELLFYLGLLCSFTW
ncbi:adenosylcobinamide-GDP ribazoletransferase [Denitratisoma sp. agr-D3]